MNTDGEEPLYKVESQQIVGAAKKEMKFPTSFTIETSRCRLRHVSMGDFPYIVSATRYAGFNEGMLWDPPMDEQELIAPYQATVKAWANDHAYSFTIEGRESKEFIGRVEIRSKEKSRWDVGFWTHPEKQNRGYMTEALPALMKFGFEELEASEITACHAIWNKASEAVLKKAGMRIIEYIPEGFKKNGTWVEENLLGITREEWESNEAVNENV